MTQSTELSEMLLIDSKDNIDVSHFFDSPTPDVPPTTNQTKEQREPVMNYPPQNINPAVQFQETMRNVCGLLAQLTEEQRQTNLLLRKLISDEKTSGSKFKIVQLTNQEKYTRFLVVLESEKSRPRLNCPICNEDVEITTAKRGGCKQQTFCGDYVVCNECTNDSLQKIMRCPTCCEQYSKIPAPICSHLSDASNNNAHLARKGSGSGCPLCSGKMIKDKCPQNCSRKDLASYNMAKTILSDLVFVLVKNPDSCIEESDRPCSHYCRCTKHKTLFTNRNKGAKCRDCTKEANKQRSLGKRKRNSTDTGTGTIQPTMPAKDIKNFTVPVQDTFVPQIQELPSNMVPSTLQQQFYSPYPNQDPYATVDSMNNSWLPRFSNVKELGKKVHLDDIFERIPYSEGVMEFGKRVTTNLSSTLGSTLGFTYSDETNQIQQHHPNHPTE